MTQVIIENVDFLTNLLIRKSSFLLLALESWLFEISNRVYEHSFSSIFQLLLVDGYKFDNFPRYPSQNLHTFEASSIEKSLTSHLASEVWSFENSESANNTGSSRFSKSFYG